MDRKQIIQEVVSFLVFLICSYLIIGFFSLVAISEGYDISYMPFWHEPWRWIFQLFDVSGAGKEVMPNGTPA